MVVFNIFTGKLVYIPGTLIGGNGTGYTAAVTNYSALPDPTTVSEQYYYVENSQGTSWLPGSLGGTYYPGGTYYSNGTIWEYQNTAYQATQADVDAGIITDQFVSPNTLTNWTGANGGQTAIFTWKYSTNTAANDPGNGFFRANNISGASITQLYVDDLTSDNQMDISALFGEVDGNWLIHIQQKNDASRWLQFTTSAPYVDNTGWWTIPVTYVGEGGGGSITNLTNCLFVFINKNNTVNSVPTSRTININGVTQDLSSNREWRTALADTGCLTFDSPGLSIATSPNINIAPFTGWVVDNETTPGTPSAVYVNYPGGSNIPVTTIGSGVKSFVLMLPDGFGSATPVFQNTLPTSAQRKTHIWLGAVAHPLGTLTVIANEPDFITSPLAQYRDMFQVLGPYINDGCILYGNGVNLQVNLTAGNIHGNGINFVGAFLNRATPDEVVTGPFTTLSFLPRTQTGLGGGAITTVDVGNYDVAGVVTAIPGSGNRATLRYFYAVPNLGFIAQYGQTWYPNISEAIAAINRETQVVFPTLPGSSVLIGVLAARKNATAIDGVQAQFFPADRLGQLVGATAGVAVGTTQTGYNNSSDPELLTNSTLGAFTVRVGSGADTDNVYEGRNIAGTTTYAVTGVGLISAASDADGTFTFGRGKLGSFIGSDTFSIAHFDNANATGYAMAITQIGDVYINAKASRFLYTMINNSAISIASSTGISHSVPLTVTAATNVASLLLLDSTYKTALNVVSTAILGIGSGFSTARILTGTLSYSSNLTFGGTAGTTTLTNQAVGGNIAASVSPFIYTLSTAYTNTASGTHSLLTIGDGTATGLSVASGAKNFNLINIIPYVNQSSTASGITAGININPGSITLSATSVFYGIRSQIASGTGKWNIYADGTAVNGFGGDLKLLTAGNGFYVKEGTNATMGVATLVAGTVVVNTTKVTANSRIFLTPQALGTVAVATPIAVTARTAGTSFTITSAGVTDTSTIAWVIIEPT